MSATWFFTSSPWHKLAWQRLFRPMAEIVKEYSDASCQQFTPEEKRRGWFEALVTGYCRPQAADFKNRQDFLCSVGLNCSCPAGRYETKTCSGQSGLTWSSCRDFDDQTTPYCRLTALGSEPKPGFAAADWQCFAPDSQITINGKNYRVADKGSAIVGRRFDIWFDNCQDAMNAIGLYQVSIPK